jgi:hypothetical protein
MVYDHTNIVEFMSFSDCIEDIDVTTVACKPREHADDWTLVEVTCFDKVLWEAPVKGNLTSILKINHLSLVVHVPILILVRVLKALFIDGLNPCLKMPCTQMDWRLEHHMLYSCFSNDVFVLLRLKELQ